MNYMKKQVLSSSQLQRQTAELAESIGEFIDYWGFRRVHGEIWAHVYLSEKPLSGSDLVKRLGVSKALVSPALKELENYDLIYQIESDDARAKLYRANEDFLSVIKTVLQKRELPLLAKVQENYDKTKQLASLNDGVYSLNAEKFSQLGIMVEQSQLALNFLLHMQNFEQLSQLALMMRPPQQAMK
jgi:DNA-binding transcriptional regulator GbsR (MarR family)